jgi:hypothetical protein
MANRRDPHAGLHSEQGASRGEHRGRAANPVVKVQDVAWLEFEKPDLGGAEVFAHAFGFTTSLRTPDELQLRGHRPGCAVRADPSRLAVPVPGAGVPGR